MCSVNIPNFLLDWPWISLWIKSISNELDITIHSIASQLSGHYDVISNRLWQHQNENQASETWGWCVKIVAFTVIYGFVMSCKKWNNVCTLMTNFFGAHSSVILVLIKKRNKHQNNPPGNAETVRHSSTIRFALSIRLSFVSVYQLFRGARNLNIPNGRAVIGACMSYRDVWFWLHWVCLGL